MTMEVASSVQSNKTVLKAIIDTQLIGLGRAFVGLPFDHLFDRIKTYTQAKLTYNMSADCSLIASIKREPLNFLKAGFSQTLLLTILKQYFRWPMMILIPKYLSSLMPTSIKENNPYLTKVIAGMGIGLFESILVCPFEFKKTQLMTSSTVKLHYKSFYTGLNIVSLKQMVSWASYLYWDAKIRHLLKSDQQTQISGPQILVCSMLTGLLNIAVVSPFDTVKTLCQMNSTNRKMNITQSVKYVINEHGFLGFYRGSGVKLASFFFQALMTTPVIDYLERNYTQ